VSYVRKVTVKTYNTSITIHEKKTGRVQVWLVGPKTLRRPALGETLINQEI
jgi:hypothetical protein